MVQLLLYYKNGNEELMKKLFSIILVLGLLISSIAFSANKLILLKMNKLSIALLFSGAVAISKESMYRPLPESTGQAPWHNYNPN